jgi:hypothetical protein
VPRHPVENHADAVYVTFVDERLEVFWRAEAAGRCEEPGHLIAPRAGKRMLEHRQQLDMCVPQIFHVRHELLRHLAIGERAIAALGRAFPRAEVHFVD